MKKQPEYKVNSPNDENSKEMVEYILSLYKRSAEKTANKQKILDLNPTPNGCKLTDYSKKISDLQTKALQFGTNDIFNHPLFGKEKAARLSTQFQSRNEVIFRLKKLKPQIEDKKPSIH